MAMRVGDIGFVAPFRYTSLIWALVLGWSVFGTWPDGMTLIGAGIVIATGIFTLYRERKLARSTCAARRHDRVTRGRDAEASDGTWYYGLGRHSGPQRGREHARAARRHRGGADAA